MSAQTATQPRHGAADRIRRISADRRARAIVAYVVLAVACAVVAYYALFSQFAVYDDEGTLLTTLSAFAKGQNLYDHIYTPYGPFYYEVFGGFFALTGKSVSTDASRLIVMVVWTTASLLFGLSVHRITGRLILGVAGMALSFSVLQVLVSEPMHPVGLSLVLISALTLVVVATPLDWPLWGGFLGGALAGALLLTKINLGVFVIAAGVFAAAFSVAALRRRRWIWLPVAAAYVAMPLILMAGDFSTASTRSFIVMATAGSLAVAIATYGGTELAGAGREVERWLRWAVAGVVLAVVLIIAVIVAAGTSLSALWQDTFVQALRQGDIFTIPFKFPAPAPIWAIGGVFASAAAVRLRFSGLSGSVWGGVGRMVAGVAIWLTAFRVAPFGLSTSPTSVNLTLAWVAVLAPPLGKPMPRLSLARVLLPAMGVALTLQAYPVAGTQKSAAVVTFVAVGAICIADGWSVLESWAGERGGVASLRFSILASLGAAALAAGFIWSGVLNYGFVVHKAYKDEPAMPIGGATRLHMPVEQLNTYVQLATLIRGTHCTALVGLPSSNSLYLWTFIDPPRPTLPGAWMTQLNDKLQQQVVDEVRRSPRPCAISYGALLGYWMKGQPPPQSPLVRYIENDFVPVRQIGGFQFLTPKQPNAAK